MRCRTSPGNGNRCSLRSRAALSVVLLVFASLFTTTPAAEEILEDDDAADCDDVGLLSGAPRTKLKARLANIVQSQQEEVQNHVPDASLHQTQVAQASESHASRPSHTGHRPGHLHRHSPTRSYKSPSSARRRRRHIAEKSSPSDEVHGKSFESGDQPVLTFIQIGSSLNETTQDFDIQDDSQATANASAAAGGSPTASMIQTIADTGVSVATAKAVRPSSEETFLVSIEAPEKLTLLLVGMLVVVVSLCAVAARFIFHAWMSRRLEKGVRERAEKLRITHGAELESLFGVHNGQSQQQPLSPGILVRIQGRVVSSDTQGSLVAPLSGQNCVMYSASVSHQRHDGIHQPVAFRSESTDFEVELSASPHLRLAVHSHDVILFDMVGGKCMCECTLAEAPDSWRAFLLGHCVPGQRLSGVALGRNDSVLDFRESALMQGVEVTCVGEIARDRNGRLSLYPWRPPPSEKSRSKLVEFVREDSRGSGWSLSEMMLRFFSCARHGFSSPAPQREGLVGRVMISDAPELLG